MGIHLAHQVDNILNLIRGDNGVEQAHLLSAVASVAVQDRDSVTVLTYAFTTASGSSVVT